MRKLTNVLEHRKQLLMESKIDNELAFKSYVHENLKKQNDYVEESAEMIAEELIKTHNGDFQSAIKALKSFLKGE